MTDIFERATRQALRFLLPQGELTTEQLWKVKEESLINYEEVLSAEVEKYGKTTRRAAKGKTTQQEQTELRLAIVSHILDVKESERQMSQSEAEIKAHNESILALIAKKEQDNLAGMSIEELRKMLK